MLDGPGALSTFLTPPRVRSRERMEGRRPGVSGGAGRRPMKPRAPVRRGRGPPGALGSPEAFPSDILPRREGKGLKKASGRGADTQTPGRPDRPLPPRSSSPPPWPTREGTHLGSARLSPIALQSHTARAHRLHPPPAPRPGSWRKCAWQGPGAAILARGGRDVGGRGPATVFIRRRRAALRLLFPVLPGVGKSWVERAKKEAGIGLPDAWVLRALAVGSDLARCRGF